MNVDQACGTGKQYIGKKDFEVGLLLSFTVGNQPSTVTLRQKAFCNA